MNKSPPVFYRTLFPLGRCPKSGGYSLTFSISLRSVYPFFFTFCTDVMQLKSASSLTAKDSSEPPVSFMLIYAKEEIFKVLRQTGYIARF